MTDQKMREALELADCALSGANMNMNVVKRKVREALAAPYDPTGTAAFKNFHSNLCKRFGYTHDEQLWWRDLVSLEEWIAKKTAATVSPEGLLTSPELAALRRFAECCEDMDADGHDVPQEMMRRLTEIGAVRRVAGPGRIHETTVFGEAILAASPAKPVCESCDGNGMIGRFVSYGENGAGWEDSPCPDCTPAPEQREKVELTECSRCDGTGEVGGDDLTDVCHACGGTGEANQSGGEG